MLPGVAPGRGPPPGAVHLAGVPAAVESAAPPAAPRRTGCFRRAVCAAPAWDPALPGRGPGVGLWGCGCRSRSCCCRGCRRLCGYGHGGRYRCCRCGRLGCRRLLRRGCLRGGLLGGRAVTVGLGLVRSGLCSAEGFAQSARDGGLHGGGCGFNEFALFAQSGEYFLAGYTEFLSQLVYAGLACHFSPV